MDNMKEYLEKKHFDKTLKKLNKKLEGKKIVAYGTGQLFDAMIENYDLSKLNIIAVSDKKYEKIKETKYLGYDVVPPAAIANLHPDYVLISTLRVVNIVEYLRYILLKGTDIKVIPFVKKSFMEIFKEIW